MEKVPRCRFCGEPVYEGNEFRTQTGKTLHLCNDCWELLWTVISDLIKEIANTVEDNILNKEGLKPFHVKGKET